jgi:hypothetical protein
MTEASDATSAVEETMLSVGDQQATGIQEGQTETELAVADQMRTPGQWEEPELTLDSVEILSRFLMGVLVLGGDELMQRLRYFQEEIEAEPWLVGGDGDVDEESTTTLLRYLAIGLYARGQKRVTGALSRGIRFSMGTARWLMGRANRATDNRLTAPLRRSVSARMRGVGEETLVVIEEGRREERAARLLAGGTINDIIDDVLDYVAENPDIAASIRHVVAQQGVSLAGVVTDNTRTVTVSGDYLAEALVRRILRRSPRNELPPSPLAGEPQTMYSTEAPEYEEVVDGK